MIGVLGKIRCENCGELEEIHNIQYVSRNLEKFKVCRRCKDDYRKSKLKNLKKFIKQGENDKDEDEKEAIRNNFMAEAIKRLDKRDEENKKEVKNG